MTVELDADPERTVEIPISRTPRNGASGSDYSVPASVTFHATETRKTISFSATHDTLDDDDERVELSFGNLPDRVLEGATTKTVVAIIDDDDPEVTVSFAQPSYSVDEADTVTVTVTLDADPERTVVIPINVDNQNGATPGDYSGVPASVSFSATETRKTISFAATDDTEDDDDERVELSFGNLPDRVLEGATTKTVVAIIDDDDPYVRVSFAQPSYSVDEADTVTVTVTLDADPERTVVIPINVDNQNGATPGDYSGVPASVSFSATETSKTFRFAATHDTLDDDDESVKLSFGAMPDERVSEGTPNTTQVSIIDDDDPEVTVTFEQSSYTVGEGSTVTVTVTLDADPERTVEIPINVDNQGGASPGDYSGVPASVSFSATETSKTFRFTATQDTVDDDDERVELSFGALPERVSEGATTETVVAIIDDDDPEVTVSFGPAELQRGRGGHGHGDGHAGRRSRTHGGDPDQRRQPERRDPRRLLGRAGQRQLQRDRDIEDIQLRRHARHAGRRRRERGAELRRPARAGLRGDAEHDDGRDRRRRRPRGPRQFRAVELHGRGGKHGHGHGRAGRRSRTHGGDPDQRGQPGRRDRRRLLGVPASVSFSATETSKTFRFTATDDTEDDDDESVELSFGAMPDERVSEGTPNTDAGVDHRRRRP